jgi:hypothetical protein
MSPRLLAILTFLGHVIIVVRGLRNYWAQLMAWDREGKIEQRGLEMEAAKRKRREADPWGHRARLHRIRAANLRTELLELRELAERRALVPFGRRIRRGPRRRTAPPPSPAGDSGAPP